MKDESYYHVDLVVNGSPKGHDIAFTSVDSAGTPGQLNRFVLKELGYSIDDIPKDFSNGFAVLEKKNLPLVVFIVSIDSKNGSSDIVITENIRLFLRLYKGSYEDFNVWIPLLGTGTARLNPLKSWESIYRAISKTKFKRLTISLPDSIASSEKNEIESHIQNWNESYGDDNELKKNELKKKKLINNRSFYLVGHQWGNDNKLAEFIRENRWENGHDEQFIDEINAVKKGDVLFAKSSWAKPGQGQLSIYAVGVVLGNLNDGHNLNVNWRHFDERIDLTKGVHHRAAFHKIQDNFLPDIIAVVIQNVPGLEEIIESLTDNIANRLSKLIRNKLDNGSNFWWINAGEKWNIDDLKIGDTESYGAKEAKGKYQNNVKSVAKFDLVIGYQAKPVGSVVGLFAITKEIGEEDRYYFELLYKFKERPTYEELKKLPVFGSSSLSKTLQGSLHKLDPTLFEEIINATELEAPQKEINDSNEHKNAVIDNDGTYTSKDLLDIENDVRSFALLLAAKSVKPPIAIALFGKWGSGKSFFMKHLAKRVVELSVHQRFGGSTSVKEVGEDSEELFCRGIAQIEFNAWSYLDANLWAGLVASIFEKLDEYINKRGKGEVEKRRIREKLGEKLQVLSSEKKLISEKREDLDTQKKELTSRLKLLNQQKQSIFSDLADKKLDDLVAEALGKLDPLSDSIKKQLAEYGVDYTSIQQPNALYAEVSSWITFLRNLGYISKKGIVVGSLSILVVLFVWINPNGLATAWFNEAGRIITLIISTVVPLFAKWYSSYCRFKNLIKPVSEYKNKFNQSFDQVRFDYQKEVDLLQVSVREKEREIKSVEHQLNVVQTKIDQVTYALENLVTHKAFNDFIRRRISDKHYESHIGLISLIRRDFETLSDLFSDINSDKSDSTDTKDDQKQSDHDELASLFKDERTLDRIILYIDDLDRCPDEKVLEVIQAVHLIMAYPLFNVVVGVDPRCVNNALLLKTKLEYLKIGDLNEIVNLGIKMISPNEYLEKIFQIPFELSEPAPDSVKRMVDHLLEGQINHDTTIEKEEDPQRSKAEKEINSSNKDQSDGRVPLIDQLLMQSSLKLLLSNANVLATTQNLRLSKEEAALLSEISFLVGNTPRTIKRYINIYRIIRANKQPESSGELTKEDQLSIMFLVALVIGEHASIAFKFFQKIRINKEKQVSDLIKDVPELFQYENTMLNNVEIRDLLKLDGNILLKHLPFVSRFSFWQDHVSTIDATPTA